MFLRFLVNGRIKKIRSIASKYIGVFGQENSILYTNKVFKFHKQSYNFTDSNFIKETKRWVFIFEGTLE